MTQSKMEKSIEVLTEISKESLRFYSELNRKGASFGFERKGLLMVSGTSSGLAAARVEMDLMAKRGIAGRWMNQRDLLDFEPALRSAALGGVYFPDEAHAEPLATVQALLQEFTAFGGVFLPGTEVFDFVIAGDEVREVITTKDRFQAEQVVLATGSWSRLIGLKLGLRIPILGGKGYSMITDSFEVKPSHPIMIVERKIAVTPRKNSVRLAGTLELVDQDDGISVRRVQAILKGSQEFLKMREQPEVSELWRGLRPCTPDGVPLIGPSGRWANLHLNCGHQMLGLQSAPGAGKLGAQLLLGSVPYVDPKPFRPSRFI